MEKDILGRLYQTTKARKTSKEYDNLRKELEELEKEFFKEVGEDKLEELERITDKIYEMDSILGKEDFCNGFSMAVKVIIGCIISKGDDQEEE